MIREVARRVARVVVLAPVWVATATLGMVLWAMVMASDVPPVDDEARR